MFKISEENNEKFVIGVIKGLRRLNATLIDHKDLGGLCASLSLNTRFGKLYIKVFYTQLHCYSIQSVFADSDCVIGLLGADSDGSYGFSVDSLLGVDSAIYKALNHFERVV